VWRYEGSWIFFRFMQVYVIAFNEDLPGQNMKFHTDLCLEEDNYLILTKSKGP
jgi:hypothetical protein